MNAERYSVSSLNGVSYSLFNRPGTQCRRWSGTKTSSAWIVLLPVPRMPATNQVSSIVMSLLGISAMAG